jgi:hypothetical protein
VLGQLESGGKGGEEREEEEGEEDEGRTSRSTSLSPPALSSSARKAPPLRPTSILTRNPYPFTSHLPHSLDQSQPTRGAKSRPAAGHNTQLFEAGPPLPFWRTTTRRHTHRHTHAMQCLNGTALRQQAVRVSSAEGAARAGRDPASVWRKRLLLFPSLARAAVPLLPPLGSRSMPSRSPSMPSRTDPPNLLSSKQQQARPMAQQAQARRPVVLANGERSQNRWWRGPPSLVLSHARARDQPAFSASDAGSDARGDSGPSRPRAPGPRPSQKAPRGGREERDTRARTPTRRRRRRSPLRPLPPLPPLPPPPQPPSQPAATS